MIFWAYIDEDLLEFPELSLNADYENINISKYRKAVQRLNS